MSSVQVFAISLENILNFKLFKVFVKSEKMPSALSYCHILDIALPSTRYGIATCTIMTISHCHTHNIALPSTIWQYMSRKGQVIGLAWGIGLVYSIPDWKRTTGVPI